jgi:hypothetical protein
MSSDSFSTKKRFINVGHARVAYVEEGNGKALALIHG